MNPKRILRLYRDEGLLIRTKRRKKRASESRTPAPAPLAPNELWTLDFMSDRLATGEAFRVLNAVDVRTRQCVGMAAARSFRASDVTEHLDRWIQTYGKPEAIQVDNGTEFTANAFDAWAYERGIRVHFITPGRPVENAVIESFNGTFRRECLNAEIFASLTEAQVVIERWRRRYNERRPHSSQNYITPAMAYFGLTEMRRA